MFAVTTASTHPVTRVVFHPNGSTFAVVQSNYGISLLDRGGGQVTATIPVPRVADYSSVLFCDGGTRLAVGSFRGVRIFDTTTGSLIGQQGGVLHGAILAERGKELIAATRAGLYLVRVADPLTRALWSCSLPFQSRATTVALSPCGRWGFGVYGRVRPSLVDTGTGRVAVAVDHPHRESGNNTPAVAFAPDGGRFAVCDGNDVAVYDTPARPEADDDDDPDPSLVERTGGAPVAPKPRAVLKPRFVLARPDGVHAKDNWRPPVAFTPDGRGLLVRRPRNRVQLWDVEAGAQAGEWGWRVDGVTCLAVAPDGLTAVAGARFGRVVRVVVWDLD